MSDGKLNLDQFHHIDAHGKITGVYDNAIFEYIKSEHDIFVLGGVPYIYEDGCYYADVSGAKLKTLIRDCIYPEWIKSTTIKRVYELFLSAYELQASYEDLNNFPSSWINFKNGFYDAETRKMFPHVATAVCKAVNQIPHEYNPDAHHSGQAIEDWLSFIVPDKDDREMLLEFAGYCMTKDTRQQKFLILCGNGGTGKSTVIRLIESVVGAGNISTISLAELSQRFAVYGLLGKLVNSCADLEVTALEDVSTLKKALGEDTLRGEAKGRDAIPFKSYAKLIFSTNELPLVKSERTNGFYRRLLVLPMNRVPDVARHDLFERLNDEIDYFIGLCVEALTRMYERGSILESAASVEAVRQMRHDSDTVEAFLQECVSVKPGERAERGELHNRYVLYCAGEDRQALSRNAFYKALRAKGFGEVQRRSENKVVRQFEGISLEKTATKSATTDRFTEVNEVLPFMRG